MEERPLRSALFSADQMKRYGRTLAATHRVTQRRKRDQLLPRLAANETVLLDVGRRLTAAVSANHRISTAGEWLLDNFHVIATGPCPRSQGIGQVPWDEHRACYEQEPHDGQKRQNRERCAAHVDRGLKHGTGNNRRRLDSGGDGSIPSTIAVSCFGGEFIQQNRCRGSRGARCDNALDAQRGCT
jgi:hypothetical protein